MTEYNFHEAHNLYPNLHGQQQFTLNKINKIKDYFIAEIKEKELMSKRLSKYIASFEYFDTSLTVLSVTTGSICIALFATVIGAPVGIAKAGFNFQKLAFSISTGIVKKLLKTTRNENKKHNKIVMLALINDEISHEDFITIINVEKNYRELKESIGMMNSQRNDTEIINLIEEGKKIGIDEIIKHNETIYNSLKSKI